MRNSGTKKRQVRPNASRYSPLIPDEIHTAQVPCCELVKEVTADVVPEAFDAPVPSEPKQSSSLFGNLLRNHFIEQRHSHPTLESLAKKKRKRKKKKKPSDASLSLDQEPEEDQSDPLSPSNNGATVFGTEAARAHKSSKNAQIVASWIDKLIQQEEKGKQLDNRCLTDFVDYIANTNPTISIDEISRNLSRVSCAQCRTQAEAYWQSTGIPAHELGIISGTGENMNNRRMYLHPRMISPSRWTLPLAGIDDDRYERAFDYVPLEEGYGTNEETDGEAWLMQSTIDRATTRPMELVMQQPLDLDGVERLTRDLILPCGLPEMEDTDAYILTDQQFHEILTRQRALELPITTRLWDMKAQKDDILEKLRMDETSLSASEDFNLKFGHAMRDMDQQCESLLGEWLELLLLLTEYYGGIAAGWTTDKIAHFWAAYSEGVNSIIRELLNHEAVLIQISSSSGVIKQMFLDASHRNSYRHLIHEKSRAVFAIHDEIFDCIVQEEEGEASFLKTLLTYESFSFVTSNGFTPAKSGLDLDLTCKSLLKAWKECSATVHCPNSKTLLIIQEERANILSEGLAQLSTTLEEEYAILDDRLLPRDKSQWKDRRHRYMEISMEPSRKENPDDDDEGSYARRLVERRKRLGCMTGIAVSQWLYIRDMQRTTSTMTKVAIPIRLKEWMITAERRDHLTIPGQQDCMGNGGKRRLACIIASLYYKWLVARCDEWHADLIQKELLEDATFALRPADEISDAKSKPATKKKRKKKVVATVAAAAPVTLASEGKGEMEAGLGVGTSASAAFAPSTISINDTSSTKGNESVEDTVSASMDRIDVEVWTPVNVIKTECSEESKSSSMPRHLPGQTEQEENNSSFEGVEASIKEEVQLGLAVEMMGLSVHSVEEESIFMDTDMQADDTMGKIDASCASIPQRDGQIEEGTDSFTIESYENGQEIQKVGVTGRNGFQLAETYLVSRLDALLENSEKSKSSIKVFFA